MHFVPLLKKGKKKGTKLHFVVSRLQGFGHIVLISSAYIAGVTLYGGPKASSFLGIKEARSFHHEYNSLACTIEIVDDVYEAIDHIHRHGRYAALRIFFSILLYSIIVLLI